MGSHPDAFDLPAYLNAVWARKTRVLAAGLLAAAVAFVTSLFLPKTYETHFTVKIGRVWYEGSKFFAHGRDVAVESPMELAEIITSPAVIREIKDELKLKDDVRGLVKRVRPYFTERTDPNNVGVLTIGIRGPTAEEAVRLAETVSRRILSRHNAGLQEAVAVRRQWEADLVKDVEAAEKLGAAASRSIRRSEHSELWDVTDLREKLRQVQLENTQLLSRQSQIISGPYSPLEPIKPNRSQNTELGFAAGVFFYLFTIFLREAIRIGSIGR